MTTVAIAALLLLVLLLVWQSTRILRTLPEQLRLDIEPSGGPVTFHLFWPRAVTRDVWTTIFATMHSGSAAERALREDLKRRLGTDAPHYRARSSHAQVEEGAEITIVPEADGVIFNPSFLRLRWLEPWHIAEFRMKAAPAGESVVGSVSFFVGPLLVADVPIEIHVGAGAADRGMRRSSMSPYRSIFVSYAHADSEIVDRLEKAYDAIGDSYLRDIHLLRSGEVWSEGLRDAIADADVFQLCWSVAAQQSEHVEDEWRVALGLQRRQFIRPVYWQKPMARLPVELLNLHFTYVPLME